MAKLKINRGTTFIYGVHVTKDGQPVSLVDATLRFTIKDKEYDDSVDDATALLSKNLTGITSDYAEFIILPNDTKALEPGRYFYDAKVDLYSDGKEVYKIDEGTIILDGSPTNRL